MARVILTSAGEDVTVGGADVQVSGTTSGGEVITIVSGNVRLDPSFNSGGDTVILPGLAANYTASLVGSEVVFTRNDGQVTLRIPVGTTANTIQFDGGDTRSLAINTTTGTVQLGTQTITATAAPLTPSGGGNPLVGYDVVNSTTEVAEGNTGTRQLVFTIELDRAVTASDGPVTLSYRTLDGTASSASDFVAAAGQVTFGVGQRFATVTVTVNGDTTQEGNETLRLELTGAALRNGTELLNGVITNDDVFTQLGSGADAFVGTGGDDVFLASNRNLGAGDSIKDNSTTDSDSVQVAVDSSIGGASTFGGFTLENIERFQVTNDSGFDQRFDLSGTQGLRTVSSTNSSSSVIFDQLGSLVTVELNKITGVNADVTANIVAAATTGTGTNVTVATIDSRSRDVNLNTIAADGSVSNTGIETVTFQTTGTSFIQTLNTNLTNLVVAGGGSLTINQALATTVRSIDASQALNVDLDFRNNTALQGVKVVGSSGTNTIDSGLGNDTITTGAGADTITDRGGNNVIVTGTGSDTVSILNGSLDKNDTITLGGDAGDTLVISQVANEDILAGVTGATNLTINAAGASVIGADDGVAGTAGETAGIKFVNLNAGTTKAVVNSSDSLDASGYTSNLTVSVGLGNDTVAFGTGNDTLRTNSLEDADLLTGGKGTDSIVVVANGSANVTTASQFAGFESIVFEGGSTNGLDQFLTLSDANAPTSGALTINAAGLKATTSTTDLFLNEQLVLNATNVTKYSVNVTGGDAVDFINTVNLRADTVAGGLGGDFLDIGGGDTARGDGGSDTINVLDGNNDVDGGIGNDTITLAGTGDSIIRGGAGNDRIVITTADFTAADTIEGGEGTDTLAVLGTYADAAFTNVTGVEIVEGRSTGVSNITLGTEAAEAGVTRVNLLNAGADTVTVGAGYTGNLTVDANAGGNDTITTGVGNDLVIAGQGSMKISTGAGDDNIRFRDNRLDQTDTVTGGSGYDTIQVDITPVTAFGAFADVNLTTVTGVENFALVSLDGLGGDYDPDAVDANDNFIRFNNAAADLYSAATTIRVDGRGLTDADDRLIVQINNNVADADIVFDIVGSDTATTRVEKFNFGVANEIRFAGGAGSDQLVINGGDASLNVTFNGNGGEDSILLFGGALADSAFSNFSSVEVVGSAFDNAINAFLGFQAASAGIVRVDGSSQGDNVTVTSGFVNSAGLLVTLNGGNDIINAGSSDATLIFSATANELTNADILTGGRGQLDRIELIAGGSAFLDGVTRVETININNNVDVDTDIDETTTVDLGLLTAAQVDGGRLTINFNNASAGDRLTLVGGAVEANLTVNGGGNIDNITTGAGADLINALGGADIINSGGGNDTINAGAGADNVNAGAGNDLVNGEAGNDVLVGGAGVDTINGGADNDTITGGLGADRLSGDAGTDVFVYTSVEDSRFTPTSAEAIDNRDTIVGFTAGTDRIDLSALAGAQAVRFNGTFSDFGSAQAALGGSAGDGNLDVVFVQNVGGRSVLFVDADNNGQLDGNDLQIVLEGLVGPLSSVDVGGPAPVAVFEAPTDYAVQFDSYQFA